MDNLKWLKRKYPTSFNKLNKYFDEEQLDEFKKSTMKIGILTKNVTQCSIEYKKGSIIQFRRYKLDSENYPLVYVILKCEEGFTQSGYHSFTINESEFKQLNS